MVLVFVGVVVVAVDTAAAVGTADLDGHVRVVDLVVSAAAAAAAVAAVARYLQ